MRPSRGRKTFVRSNYPQAFLTILDEFRDVMLNHHGNEGPITCREYTVELLYTFAKTTGTDSDTNDKENVVLNVSHDFNKKYTKHYFGGEADKPHKYKRLKEDIDQIGASHSKKAAIQHFSSVSRPDGVNIFAEIRKALETLNCALEDPHTTDGSSEIRHGKKFVGKFKGTEFAFNVYTKKDGRLNTKKQSVTWDRPNIPPIELKGKIDEVVNWVKMVEAGHLEIEAGPNVDDDVDNLISGVSRLTV
jgi:hypothetical protein